MSYGHDWERDDDDNATCKCGAKLSLGKNRQTDPAVKKPCPLYKPLTEDEFAAITKKNMRDWTVEERTKISDSAAAVRQARKDALEPFAKLGEAYCDEALADVQDSSVYDSPLITIGMDLMPTKQEASTVAKLMLVIVNVFGAGDDKVGDPKEFTLEELKPMADEAVAEAQAMLATWGKK
jgi:hypothetical protein